jgi:mannose-6-phosphate isomerase-like protein (cupin superfamily)
MRNKYLIHPGEGRDEPIKDLKGASREILVDERAGAAEDITFGFSRYEPRTSAHKKHAHPEAEEIMYILKGRGISGVADQEFEVRPGDTIWVPRGVNHWFYNPFDEPCEFVFLYTRPSLKLAGHAMAEQG